MHKLRNLNGADLADIDLTEADLTEALFFNTESILIEMIANKALSDPGH